jgi:hypothetical protein
MAMSGVLDERLGTRVPSTLKTSELIRQLCSLQDLLRVEWNHENRKKLQTRILALSAEIDVRLPGPPPSY